MTAPDPEPRAVVSLVDAAANRARQLAERLGLAWSTELPAEGLVLALPAADRLVLLACEPDAPGPIEVDLVDGPLGYRLRQGIGRAEPLIRAIGLGKGRRVPAVLDATAGLGRDAAVLAAAGVAVLACERSAVLAALLTDGLERARRGPPPLPELAARITPWVGDARRAIAEHRPDVVLLDPMFPDRRKSALVRKEMRLVRRLVGTDDDAGDLLATALRHAGQRVVVKRPAGAASLPGPPPDHSQGSGQTRFDVYLSAGRGRPAGTPRSS